MSCINLPIVFIVEKGPSRQVCKGDFFIRSMFFFKRVTKKKKDSKRIITALLFFVILLKPMGVRPLLLTQCLPEHPIAPCSKRKRMTFFPSKCICHDDIAFCLKVVGRIALRSRQGIMFSIHLFFNAQANIKQIWKVLLPSTIFTSVITINANKTQVILIRDNGLYLPPKI